MKQEPWGDTKTIKFPMQTGKDRAYTERTRKYAKRRVKDWKRTYVETSYFLKDYGWTHPCLVVERK